MVLSEAVPSVLIQQRGVDKKTSAIMAVHKALAEAASKAAQGWKAMSCKRDASEASSLEHFDENFDVPPPPPEVHHTPH
jgi:hypothetical protein